MAKVTKSSNSTKSGNSSSYHKSLLREVKMTRAQKAGNPGPRQKSGK